MTTTPMRPAAALVTALTTDMAARSFVDLVRGRIYAPELPRDENGNIPQEMPMPCVVVQAIGGGSLGPGGAELRALARYEDCYPLLWGDAGAG